MSGRVARDATGPERRAQSLAIAKLAELRQARLEKAALVPFADQTNCSSSRHEGASNSLEGAPCKTSEPASHVASSYEQGRLREPLQQTDGEGSDPSVDFRRLRKGIKTYEACDRDSRPEERGAKPKDTAKIAASQPCQRLLRSGSHGDDESTLSDLFDSFGSLSLDNGGAYKALPSDAPKAVNTDSPKVSGHEVKKTTLQTDLNLRGKQHSFSLLGSVASSLYDHQVIGIKWLWGLFDDGCGGILADDMGLGKTMQCAAFLAGGLRTGAVRSALIVAPKTLLAHWAKELTTCGVGNATREFYGSSSHDRNQALTYIQQKGGVLLTTYGMVLHNVEQLMHATASGGRWDALILDEGHKIKNTATLLAQKLRTLEVKMRIIISGTPVQNNLGEMHALFDFVQPGLLGESRWFKMHYSNVITEGSDKHAPKYARDLSIARAAELRTRIQPFFLRREKDILGSKDSGTDEGCSRKVEPPTLGHKNDLVVWLKLQPMQRKVYEDFLESDAVRAVFNQTSSALAALTVLKKICDHPALLTERSARLAADGAYRVVKAKAHKALRKSSAEDSFTETSDEEDAFISEDDSDDDASGGGDSAWTRAANAASNVEKQLIDELRQKGASASCKTMFVMSLLRELVTKGHRALVFSQSRVMLNIIEAGLRELNFTFLRIDGTINSAAERQARVTKFQSRADIPVFLLTSQVGGLGLTLTGADRVIIVDPAWNPSVDAQSVDRAYRIGQEKDVVVYRLITCGTVEEKIYRKQVFKGGLSRSSTKEGSQFRYFSQQELRNLFRVEPGEFECSPTQAQLHDLHAKHRVQSQELAEHISWLESVEGFAGISDHDLLFSKNEDATGGDHWRNEGRAQSVHHFKSGNTGSGCTTNTFGLAKGKAAARRTALTSSGWSGVSDIADMMQRTLQIGTSVSEPRPPQHSALGKDSSTSNQSSQGSKSAGGEAELKLELEAQIRKQEALLSNPNLKLPDGGANVRRRLQHLKEQLEGLGSCSASCSGGDSTKESSSSTAESGPQAKEACPSRDDSSLPRSCSTEQQKVSFPTVVKANVTSVSASGIAAAVGRGSRDCIHAKLEMTRGTNSGAVLSATDEARAASKSVGASSHALSRSSNDSITEPARRSDNQCQNSELRLTFSEAPAAVESAGVREGTTSDQERHHNRKFGHNPSFELLSPRLAAAVGTPLPEHRGGGVKQAEQISQLHHQIRLLKTRLEMDASILRDPIKRERLPDRGAEVEARFKATYEERETLKKDLKALQSSTKSSA